MHASWSRLDRSVLFDPARWPARALLVGVAGVLGSLAFILRRISFLPRFPGIVPFVEAPLRALEGLLSVLPAWLRPGSLDLGAYYGAMGFSSSQVTALWWARAGIWSVETGVWVAYIVAFLVRVPARSLARGFMETAFPALVAVLPMAIASGPYTLDGWLSSSPRLNVAVLGALDLVLLVAGAVHVAALFTLRRAFTITTEARALVRHGPYRWVRHPVYAAHFLIFGTQALLRAGALNAVLFAAFVVAQRARSRLEERKLAAAFPEYADYLATTPAFLPRLRRAR